MSVRAVARQLRPVVHRHGVRAGVLFLSLAALRRQMCLEHVIFFELAGCPAASETRAERQTRRATAAEILEMADDPVWDMTGLTAGDVDNLLAAGHRCVLNVVDGRVAGYAWMNPSRIIVPKLRLAIPLVGELVHVYKGFTHPDFRGQRLCVDRFAHWYTHLTEGLGLMVVVDFSFDNPATLARAGRCRLRRIGTGTYVRRGGFERCWLTGSLARMEREVIAHDIAHRDH